MPALPFACPKGGIYLSIRDWLFARRDKATLTRLVDMHIRGWTNPLAGRALYSIPEIRTAINFIAEKAASVPFRHVRVADGGVVLPLEDNIQRVLAVRPNPYNTPQAFVNVIVTRLLVNGYAYIYPEWEGKALKGLYPLPFTSHALEKDPAGQQWVIFEGDSGKMRFMLEDLIILNRFPALGEGRRLTTYSDPVTNYVNILGTIQGQAVDDAESAGRIAGLLETQVMLNEADMQKKLEAFRKAFLTSENVTGLGMLPTGYKFIPVDFKRNPLNTELLNTITRQLYNYYGVSFEIINGSATELQYEQFVDNTVKPICYSLEEELTYKLFTDRELFMGHRIQAETVDLEISTLQAKTAFFKEMIFGGVMNRNEVRKRIGLPKGPAELDEYTLSKNFSTKLEPGTYEVEGGDDAGKDNAGTGKDPEDTGKTG